MSSGTESSSDSDYNVDEFVKPKRRRKQINDDSADLLGNFDDQKRKEILDGTYEEKSIDRNPSDPEDSDEDEAGTERTETAAPNSAGSSDSGTSDDDEGDEEASNTDAREVNTNLSKEQLASLLRGTSKQNRYVLYVTNLNFESTREDLETHFGRKGTVKSVRIPKKRRGGFAFVEMADVEGFQQGFQLHNSELQGRNIKVQISEAGKKKSANKKNIIKQKNRKLAEMRNEQKTFTKSGKFYDKTLKKEKAKELMERKRWRKNPTGGGKRS